VVCDSDEDKGHEMSDVGYQFMYQCASNEFSQQEIWRNHRRY